MTKYFIIIVLFFVTQLSFADDNSTKHQFHHPQKFMNSLQGDATAGKKIYEQFCANCHAQQPLIQLGAPRIGVTSDWKARMKPINQLLDKINPGLNAMPPRGGCFECSDEQLKAAIVYMLPDNSK